MLIIFFSLCSIASTFLSLILSRFLKIAIYFISLNKNKSFFICFEIVFVQHVTSSQILCGNLNNCISEDSWLIVLKISHFYCFTIFFSWFESQRHELILCLFSVIRLSPYWDTAFSSYLLILFNESNWMNWFQYLFI